MLDAVHVLAASQDLAANNFGDTRTGGLAGPMGLFLILLLAAATVLLIRNMNVRLRRLPSRFEHGQAEDAPSTERNVLDPTELDVRPGSPL
ncbi:hypothetical protein [Micromonospora sp. LOL_023]|uniref:hypothetical protein n=1 Tax=Micromonospora sp. LOL_023 TaxID=3345418 RepID=UPI003A8580CD